MKFHFPFENVRKHRKTLEDIAQRDFQESYNILIKMKRDLDQMYEDLHSAHQRVFKIQSVGGSVGQALIQMGEYIVGQREKIRLQIMKIEAQDVEVEKMRVVLNQKAVEYKIIDRLKDRKREIFEKEKRKKEFKTMDDINMIRYKPRK